METILNKGKIKEGKRKWDPAIITWIWNLIEWPHVYLSIYIERTPFFINFRQIVIELIIL